MTHTIHVVGSINHDQRLLVDTPPAPGETITAHDHTTEPGGKGANQATAAARAGAPVRLIGAVGDDDTAAHLRRHLTDAGIDTTHVATTPGPTGRAIVTVAADGQNQIIIVPGANAHLTPEHATTALTTLTPGDLVLLQLELPRATVAAAAAFAHHHGGYVILNAAPANPAATPILDHVDLLAVNEPELATIAHTTGTHTPDAATTTRRLADTLDTTVVCTLGDKGAILATPHTTHTQPAHPATVVDTTSAGDTFIGYLAAALAHDHPWPHALDTASRAAAITVTRPGAARSIPTHTELDPGE